VIVWCVFVWLSVVCVCVCVVCVVCVCVLCVCVCGVCEFVSACVFPTLFNHDYRRQDQLKIVLRFHRNIHIRPNLSITTVFKDPT